MCFLLWFQPIFTTRSMIRTLFSFNIHISIILHHNTEASRPNRFQSLYFISMAYNYLYFDYMLPYSSTSCAISEGQHKSIDAEYIPFKFKYQSETFYIVWQQVGLTSVTISSQYCNYCGDFLVLIRRLPPDFTVFAYVGGPSAAGTQRIFLYDTAYKIHINLLLYAT
jgi:hypothetical protein